MRKIYLFISVVDIIGRVIKEQDYQDIDEIILDMSEQMSGIYFVYLDFGTARITKKLIVNKK